MKVILIHSFLLLFCIQIKGQNLNPLVKEAELLLNKTKTKIVFPSNEDAEISFHQALEITKNSDVNQLEIDLKKYQAKQFHQDIGLSFRAGAVYNFRESYDQQTFSNNIGTASIGLEWDLLKTGLRQNRISEEKLHNEITTLHLDSYATKNHLWRRQFRININFVLNIETIELFQNHLDFENEYFDFLNKLYVKKLINRESLLKVSNQITVLEKQVKHYKNQNRILRDSISPAILSQRSLPFPDLDLQELQIQDKCQSLELREKNIELDHHYSNDYSLTLIATQNYTYSNFRQVFFPLVGIRFRAPIRFNQKSNIIKTKKQILRAQEKDKSVGQYNQIITQTNAYAEKVRDLQNQYKSWEIINERIRVLSLLKTELNSTESGYRVLQLIENQFEVLENCLQLKRQLYVLVSQLQNYENIEKSWSPVRFGQNKSNEIFKLEKSEVFSMEFQIQYIQAKKLNNIVISDETLNNQLNQENIHFSVAQDQNIKTVAELIQKDLQTIKK
ncbi:hypothetical protein [Flavicella marina]|uniref:hypothetical protein n=1 Tax=Flavicella marina TaxID=1475951 RepID=UPI00126405DE|nr:hypothetical protein [Flavicella marina]